MRMGRSQTPSTKSRKPSGDRFRQQRMDSWQPIMTPFKIIAILVIVAVLFIPAGCGIFEASKGIFEMRKVYDGSDASDVQCQVSKANEGRNCNVTFVFNENVNGPLLVQYELNRFYQNHRKYVSSFSSAQLMGKNVGPGDKGLSVTCDPSTTNGTQGLNPCGLIAKSFFTDIFTLIGSSVKGAELNEKLISADADRDVKFKQIDGFQSKVVADNTVSCATAGLPEGCKFYRNTKTGLSHLFYYPSDSSVQYLYEMYPDQISPLEGVTNEHFIVWMRTAPLPKFRKLYGRIHQNFKKGDTLKFNIKANFEVRSFNGEKALIITNSGLLGSKNPALGIVFIVIGCLSLVLAAVFLMKEYQSPRQLGHGKSV